MEKDLWFVAFEIKFLQISNYLEKIRICVVGIFLALKLEMREDLISFLLLFSVIGNIKKGVSEEPCFKYVKCEPKNQCGCGIENKKVTYNRTKLNSRIVNGETVAGHIYPWMARMQITTVFTNANNNCICCTRKSY